MTSGTAVLDPRAHILFGGLRSALADLVEALGERTQAALSSRELDVVSPVHDGLSNNEIARRLFLSERTVAKDVENILRKLVEPALTRTGAPRPHGVVRRRPRHR